MALRFANVLAHAPSHVPPPEALHRHEHSHEHHCVHEKLTPATAHGIAPQTYGDATEKALSGGGAGGARLPLRIVINDDSLFADEHACLEAGGRRRDAFDPNSWQACEPADVLTAEKRTLLVERMMPRATAFFSRLLKVRRVDGRLRLSGTICGYEGGVRVPEAYRTAGVADADIVVFLTARPIASYGAAGDTIAYAGHCEADQHGRPISAHFNWSPRTLSPPSDEWLEGYLLRVALHELRTPSPSRPRSRGSCRRRRARRRRRLCRRAGGPSAAAGCSSVAARGAGGARHGASGCSARGWRTVVASAPAARTGRCAGSATST